MYCCEENCLTDEFRFVFSLWYPLIPNVYVQGGPGRSVTSTPANKNALLFVVIELLPFQVHQQHFSMRGSWQKVFTAISSKNNWHGSSRWFQLKKKKFITTFQKHSYLWKCFNSNWATRNCLLRSPIDSHRLPSNPSPYFRPQGDNYCPMYKRCGFQRRIIIPWWYHKWIFGRLFQSMKESIPVKLRGRVFSSHTFPLAHIFLHFTSEGLKDMYYQEKVKREIHFKR